ncbi:MAG: DNA double-strand break repair nuclease NurA [Promethearchaeota archaeon]
MIKGNFSNLDAKEIDELPLKGINLKRIGQTKEQLLAKNLKVLAQEYIQLEKTKKNFADLILKNFKKLDFSEFLNYAKFYIKENYIKKSANSSCISGLNIVSVDGSSAVKRFMNVDFSFLKAICVKYDFYNEGKSAKIKYFPDLSGFNNYSVQGNYFNREENVVESKVSMDMTFMEINLLNNFIEQSTSSDIDLIIIDGSIVIMPINLLFSKDPEISIKYDRLLREYHKLYLNCKDNGILLVGSIKDTRTSGGFNQRYKNFSSLSFVTRVNPIITFKWNRFNRFYEY